MAIVEGMGTCLVPKDSGVPCGMQIEQGDPIRTLQLPFGGAVIGHKGCVDGYEARKKQELDDTMVKRVDQAGPGGAVDMTQAKDAIIGSVPLEQTPNRHEKPELTPTSSEEVAWPEGIVPVASLPFREPVDTWAAGRPETSEVPVIREFTPERGVDEEEEPVPNPSPNDIDNRFTYHSPTSTQIDTYQVLRSQARDFAHAIDRNCPDSREKSLALTSLDQTVMWANASIARNS